MTVSTAIRTAVSIVCVFNDADVLRTCLQRSVALGRREAPDTELIAVDNRDGHFATAGAALNHGLLQASNPVVVFAHQDVFLHSLAELERVAAIVEWTPEIGVLGAVGIDDRGQVVGRVRDRVIPLGRRASGPEDVDTMDEVLFMASREQLAAEPLADDPRLGWHAYAVEYSLRMRRAGRRAVVHDIPLTHNSLTTNLQNLDVAHRRVAECYPTLLPAHTTCGMLTEPGAAATIRRVVHKARRARIWWRESVVARRITRATRAAVVLADIRFLVDDAARLGEVEAIRTLDLAPPSAVRTGVGGLERFGLPFSAETASSEEIESELRTLPERTALVVSGLTVGDLLPLLRSTTRPVVVGYTHESGVWMLAGIEPTRLARLWTRRRHRPFPGGQRWSDAG